MATPPKNDGWLMVLFAVLLLAGLTLVGAGLVYFLQGKDPTLLAMGVLAVIVPASLYPIASAMQGRGGDSTHAEGGLDRDLLQGIHDRLLLSDTAKRIIYREQERAALRQAIQEDMNKHDYEAALVLVNEMSQTYGYRQEAESFRDEIQTARKVEDEQRVTEGLAQMEAVMGRAEWDRAMAEADKLARLFPESPRVRGLERQIKEARERHKRDLERQFLQASERDDVETAMDLLKQLDKYLTEQEAEPFRETARGVIGKKRQNLGVQFKLSVHDKEWTQAVRIGEQIIREFPNSKMSDEVRGMLDLLRERAAGEQAARTQAARV